MKTFELSSEFLQYLELVGLNIETLPAIQLQEIKRAFYGGCGRMHRLMEKCGEIAEASEIIATINDLEDQINIFWVEQDMENVAAVNNTISEATAIVPKETAESLYVAKLCQKYARRLAELEVYIESNINVHSQNYIEAESEMRILQNIIRDLTPFI